MKSRKAFIALAIVALALVGSIFVIPSLALPRWAGELEEGEEFVPPCLTDGEFEPGTYGPGPYSNETCPFYPEGGGLGRGPAPWADEGDSWESGSYGRGPGYDAFRNRVQGGGGFNRRRGGNGFRNGGS